MSESGSRASVLKALMISSKIGLALLGAAGVLALCACLPPQVAELASMHPAFRPSAGDLNQVGPSLNGYSQATVPQSGLIVVEGDGVAYGVAAARGRSATAASTPQSRDAFPKVLQALLGVAVENRGHPGDTIAAGEARWDGRSPGNLLILAYGFSDAKAKTSPADFAASLDRMLSAAHAGGAAIMLLTPPAYADPALSATAEAYRHALRQAQTKYGASLFELDAILAPLNPRPTDGSFQTDKGYRAIAYTIAPYIAVARPPKPPAF